MRNLAFLLFNHLLSLGCEKSCPHFLGVGTYEMWGMILQGWIEALATFYTQVGF